MGVREAIKILRENGYIVNYTPSLQQYHMYYGGDPEPYCKSNYHTAEEIIKRAKWQHSHHGKGALKHYDHRRDRRATKQKIAHEKYDDLSNKKQTKRENSWNWD